MKTAEHDAVFAHLAVVGEADCGVVPAVVNAVVGGLERDSPIVLQFFYLVSIFFLNRF
jgi:hypothetical protein